MKYVKSFLIIMIIYPLISWVFDMVRNQEQQIWHYILSGVVVGILFIIILYFIDKNKEHPMRKYLFTFITFAFLYLAASWANFLVVLPDHPYLWWVHILFALLTGVIGVTISYFRDKKKKV